MAILLATGVVFAPAAVRGEGPQGLPQPSPSVRGTADELSKPVGGDCSDLKIERGRLIEALDEAMVRLKAADAALAEKSKLQADNAALRGLLSAVQGQLQSLEMLQRQEEQRLSALEVQSEERGALLAVAADNLQACETDKAALLQDLASLRQEKGNQDEIKTKLAQKVRESVSRLMTLQSQCTTVENELRALRDKVGP